MLKILNNAANAVGNSFNRKLTNVFQLRELIKKNSTNPQNLDEVALRMSALMLDVFSSAPFITMVRLVGITSTPFVAHAFFTLAFIAADDLIKIANGHSGKNRLELTVIIKRIISVVKTIDNLSKKLGSL